MSLTMLDKFAMALTFIPFVVSSLFVYVTRLDKELILSELLFCNPLSISCNCFMSVTVDVANKASLTV